jgi:hypothetical protein
VALFQAGSRITAAALNQLGPQVRTITANQLINSTTDVVVGANSVPMSWAVTAGPVYVIAGMINWSQGATGVSQNNGFTGPAISGCRIRNEWMQATQFAQQTNTREANTLSDQASPAFAATLAVEWNFLGSVVFSAAGTFSIVAGEGTVGDPFTIGAYSHATLLVSTT